MHHRRIESFLLRVIVDEQGGTQANGWRGRVQHIGSGSEIQFDTLHDMLAIIHTHVSLDQPDLDSQPTGQPSDGMVENKTTAR